MEIPKKGDEDELPKLQAFVWLKQIQTAFERGEEASRAGEADRDEADPDEAEPVEASRSAKAAKKNRKERERRARRKREQNAGGASDTVVTDAADTDVQNRGQGVEERLDLAVEQRDVNTNTVSKDVQEDITLVQSVKGAEPHKLLTKPKQDTQVTLPSPRSTADAQTTPLTTTTVSGKCRTSRSLMIPAVPFDLQFSKKPSTTMQHEKLDTQSPATEQESDSSVAQIAASTADLTVSEAQATTKEIPETEIAGADTEAKQSPEGPLNKTKSPVSATSVVVESTEPPAPVPAQVPAAACSSEIEDPQASIQQSLVKFDTYEWPCRRQECRKLTSPYDESTVICPRCGPYSLIRYCSKKCLFDDLLMHWGVECGSFTLAKKADPSTVTKRQVSIQPYIPSLDHIDCPERFRQFVRHSLDKAGDYFIFSDWADWRNEGFPMPWPAERHASGSILAAVNFAETGTAVPSRALFTRLLRVCFLVGGSRTDMAYFLFKMIIGRLTELGLATDDVKNCLVWQMKKEFAYPGGFADLLMDQQVVNWPLAAGQVVQLEIKYRAFLVGGVHLGAEWSNKV